MTELMSDSKQQPATVGLLDGLRMARAARASRRQLEHELASYRTDAERADLDAMIERCTAPDADRIRAIVDRVRAA